MLLASSGQRPGLLCKVLRCTGRSPQQVTMWPQMSSSASAAECRVRTIAVHCSEPVCCFLAARRGFRVDYSQRSTGQRTRRPASTSCLHGWSPGGDDTREDVRRPVVPQGEDGPGASWKFPLFSESRMCRGLSSLLGFRDLITVSPSSMLPSFAMS